MSRDSLPSDHERAYVILRHDPPSGADASLSSGRGLHWDLMFDYGAKLRTWALSAEPWEFYETAASRTSAADELIRATSLADHRREYLDYEGPVSGNRGSVSRVDRGTYRVLRESLDEFLVELSSARGRLVIQLTHPVDHASDSWLARISRPN